MSGRTAGVRLNPRCPAASCYDGGMRVRLKLDEDLAVRLRAEAQKTGKPLGTVVGEVLRDGFKARASARIRRPFKVKARPMGLRPGLNLDCISALTEQLEGPFYR